MSLERVLVAGGAGFIGTHVVARLCARGIRVVVPTRHRQRARHLLPLPTVEVVQARAGDAAWEAALAGCDAVVNLAGVLHSRWGDPYGPEFRAAHVTFPAWLATAARRAGAGRIVHVSALGVGDDPAALPSMYLRSKADGERAVREAGLPYVILRPSVVFGPEDRFLNTFARLQRLFPVLPLARADARFQPVYVGDVATAIVNALQAESLAGRTLELAGPEVYTLGEMVALAGRWSGHARPIWALPFTLGQMQAGILGALPKPLMSSDNFDSMRIDNVASGPIDPDLGVEPTPLAVAQGWLSRHGSRLAAQQARAHR
jgi:NADH dehydrogenase